MTTTSTSANRVIRIVAASFLFALAPAFGRSKASVAFTSPCTCEGNHGVARWAAKTDKEQPPSNPGAIQRITPADICRWEGPGQRIGNTERLPAEQKWYAVECRIAAVKVEEDGDLHIEVQNSDEHGGRVVVEVPLGDTWCEIRKAAFAWTDAKFPLKRGQFKTVQHPIVTIIGRAFYDIDHAGGDMRNNQRGQNVPVAVWEIHPVMQLKIGDRTVASFTPSTEPIPTSVISPTPPSSPSVAAAPSPLQEQFVTITQPITIKIPYGTTVLQRGMRLPVVTRDATTVRVRYMGQVYALPKTVTDSEQPSE